MNMKQDSCLRGLSFEHNDAESYKESGPLPEPVAYDIRPVLYPNFPSMITPEGRRQLEILSKAIIETSTIKRDELYRQLYLEICPHPGDEVAVEVSDSAYRWPNTWDAAMLRQVNDDTDNTFNDTRSISESTDGTETTEKVENIEEVSEAEEAEQSGDTEQTLEEEPSWTPTEVLICVPSDYQADMYTEAREIIQQAFAQILDRDVSNKTKMVDLNEFIYHFHYEWHVITHLEYKQLRLFDLVTEAITKYATYGP